MSSHNPYASIPAFVLVLLGLWLAFSPAAEAASGTAFGNGASASASVDFRIVIPGRLQMTLDRSADGGQQLRADMHSRRGALTVNTGEGDDARLAQLGEGDIVKTSRIDTTGGGVYTIASP